VVTGVQTCALPIFHHLSLQDLTDINVDLYQPAKFVPLNKENFLKIFS
jgi:hypothetical protein